MARLSGVKTLLVCAAWLLTASVLHAATVIEEVPGQPVFSFEFAGATDFSGIAWAGGADYYVVSDKVKGVFPMRIMLDPASGAVREVKVGRLVPVRAKAGDFEGIAFHPAKHRLYVCGEEGSAILAIHPLTGAASAVGVPPVFSRIRRNKGLESLTIDVRSGAMWSANEEALEGDGPVSGVDAGTLVRLQKFDARMKPVVQFAYRTEPSRVRLSGAGTGVCDLAALPNGELLILERVANRTGLSVKIFRAVMKSATDVSGVSRLEGAAFQPVEKVPLFERATLAGNFEGIALGPELEGRWRSLLLIADSGGGTTHYLMPLRIRYDGGP